MQTIDLAKEELKRVDHMFYVSLKYTRTCDVIKNIIKRMLAAYDYTFSAILESLEEDGKIDSVPSLEKNRVELVSKSKTKYKDYIKHYNLLKKIDEAEFDRREEYRKHVTLSLKFDEDSTLEVNVPTILEYYKKVDDFVNLVGEDIS